MTEKKHVLVVLNLAQQVILCRADQKWSEICLLHQLVALERTLFFISSGIIA